MQTGMTLRVSIKSAELASGMTSSAVLESP